MLVVGPLARSADDLALALDILVETDDLEPVRRHKFTDHRVAVWTSDPYPKAEIDGEVSNTLKSVVEKLHLAGVEVDMAARPTVSLREINEVYSEIMDELLARRFPLQKALLARQKSIETAMAVFFEHYDVLLAPVTPTVAFPHDHTGSFLTRHIRINSQRRSMLNNLSWATVALVPGLPATSAPLGLSDKGMPVGIQIIGAKRGDRTTIAFARGLTQLMGGFRIPSAFGE